MFSLQIVLNTNVASEAAFLAPVFQWETCLSIILQAEPQQPGLAITTFTSGGFGGAKQMVEAAGSEFGSRAALTSIHQSEDTFRCKSAGVGTLREQESLAVKLLAFHDVREDLQAPCCARL